MKHFKFDLQRFSTRVIAEGETYELYGVNYTAVGGEAQLNLDADDKVSGIASGQVQVTLANKENSPGIYFNGGEKSLTVSFQNNDGTLIVTQSHNGLDRIITLTEGNLQVDGYKITSSSSAFSYFVINSGVNYKFTSENSAAFDVNQDTFTMESNQVTMTIQNDNAATSFNISGKVSKEITGYTYSATAGTSISTALGNGYNFFARALSDTGEIISFVSDGVRLIPDNKNSQLQVALMRNDGTVAFGGVIQCKQGAITLGQNGSFHLDSGTSFDFSLGNYTFSMTATDSATLAFAPNAENQLSFTPGTNDGALNVVIKKGDTTIFQNTVSVEGTINLNPENGTLTLTSGSKISLAFENYSVTATAIDNVSNVISINENGISIAPTGKLNLNLATSSGAAMNIDVEVLSGSFSLGNNGSLNIAKDTELQLTFSENYSVKFKTTGDAGGIVSLDSDGIHFSPNADDGDLEISVTRDGVTRTTNLNMTGSLTYKLDGSISLAKGTVLTNNFEDGNILRITANTDASGSIIFHPQSELTIIPSTADALNVVLTTDSLDVVNISSITGTINYNGGIITASDGTQAHLSVYDNWESELRTNGGSSSIQFTADRTVYTANAGATFVLDYLEGTTLQIQNGSFTDIYATETQDAIEIISTGATFRANDDEFIFTLEKAGNYNLNGIKVVTESDNVQVQLTNYDTVIFNGLSYTALDENVTLTIGNDGATVAGGKVSLKLDGFNEAFDFNLTDGGISYANGKFTVKSGSKSYINQGNFPTEFIVQNDFSVQLTKKDDGLYAFTFPDGSADFSVVNGGVTLLSTSLTLNGEILFNPETHEIFLTKGTNFALGNSERSLQITALDTAGGQLTLTASGIRFAPHENDGALEFNFIGADRKATLDVTGAFTYGGNGRMSLEDGTKVNFVWEDGNTLQLNSHGSTGYLTLDMSKGIGITSADENLDITFTTAEGYTTSVSSVQGTIWYNAGRVNLDANTKLTGTGTLGGQNINVTLETIDGDGYLIFGSSGMNYGAGTGKLRVTFTLGNLASTFTVNSGEVFIGHNVFNIAVGSNIATDLQNFIPALNFRTTDLGEYTINGQKITTTAENLALTATDNQMIFKTSSNAVVYDGMNFTGNGNVTLTAAAVVLGNGVVATGFGKENTFVLSEQGTVTADEKIFELTESVSAGISVKGADDGFIFSQTVTKESEERIGIDSPSDIGKIFKEEFHSAGDNSYRIEVDLIGLKKVIGISDGATITGSATLENELEETGFDVVTEMEGVFTIGDKSYTISGDSSAIIETAFDTKKFYAEGFDDLNGTVNGDFTANELSINGNSPFQVFGDKDVSVHANENGYEVYGLDANASIKVTAAGTYVVNSTSIETSGTNFIVGNEDGTARLLYENYIENATANTVINGTSMNDGIYNVGENTRINGLGGNDTIKNNNASNVSIDAGEGDDKIITYGSNNTINGGEGNNLINFDVVGRENSVEGSYIIFKGNTTLEGNSFGFGQGTDTIYFYNNAPSCGFKSEGFTLYDHDGDDNYSQLIFAGAHNTTKLTFYYEKETKINKAIFIPANTWYTVEEGDFSEQGSVRIETYFVGASDPPSQGVNFSNISRPLNVTLDTEYDRKDIFYWVNSIYSIVGGASNTTITGSINNDTIFAGSGPSTLWGSKGDDYLEGGTNNDTFAYALGDGNDTINNAGEGDFILLSDISIDKILSANISAESVALNFSDGGSINISGKGEIYQLADGSKYSADREKLEWNAV